MSLNRTLVALIASVTELREPSLLPPVLRAGTHARPGVAGGA